MKTETLFTEDEILKRVAELGKEITKYYAGQELLVITVLKRWIYVCSRSSEKRLRVICHLSLFVHLVMEML